MMRAALLRPVASASAGSLTLLLLAVGFLFFRGSGRKRAPQLPRGQVRAQDPAPEDPSLHEELLRSRAPQVQPSEYRRFRLTRYWITDLAAGSEDIVDEGGRVLAGISRASKARLQMEGTGRLPDGRIVNVWGKDTYQVLARGTQALGVGARPLRALRSVASDAGGKPWKDEHTRQGPLVPTGTPIYIRELAGLALPGGEVHDGWVTAEDTGGAIYGAHLDLFVGDAEVGAGLPEEVSIWFPGIEEIPADYGYGLKKARGDYRKLRPPPPGRGGIT